AAFEIDGSDECAFIAQADDFLQQYWIDFFRPLRLQQAQCGRTTKTPADAAIAAPDSIRWLQPELGSCHLGPLVHLLLISGVPLPAAPEPWEAGVDLPLLQHQARPPLRLQSRAADVRPSAAV